MDNLQSLPNEAANTITGVIAPMTPENQLAWFAQFANAVTYALKLGGSRYWEQIPADEEDGRIHLGVIFALIGVGLLNVLAQLEWDEPTTHGRAALLAVLKHHAESMGNVIDGFNEGADLTYEEAEVKANSHYAALADNLHKLVKGEFTPTKPDTTQQ